MRRRFLAPVMVVLCFLVMRGEAPAAVLQSFDRLFAGDDPTEGFTFVLPYDPTTPNELRFDGFAENLAVDETGVRFFLNWGRTGVGDGDGLFHPGEPDFGGVRLPGADPMTGSVRVPVHFGVTMDYSPGGVLLVVEGLGPSDYFRLIGDLTLEPVPEPATWALLMLAGLGLGMVRWGRAPN